MARTIELADSTIAMSLYNLLALAGEATFDRLYSVLLKVHDDVTREQAQRAFAELQLRSWAVQGQYADTFKLRDPQSRPCTKRARTNNGWDGWLVRGPTGQLTPIEDAK